MPRKNTLHRQEIHHRLWLQALGFFWWLNEIQESHQQNLSDRVELRHFSFVAFFAHPGGWMKSGNSTCETFRKWTIYLAFI